MRQLLVSRITGHLASGFWGRIHARPQTAADDGPCGVQDQGVVAPKRLPHKLAEHILSGSTKPFKYRGGAQAGNISLTFEQTDVDEMAKRLSVFCETKLPEVLDQVGERASRRILKDLKSRWPREQASQEADLSKFRKRLEDRWGKPLGQLRMLLTMSREWCQHASTGHNLSRTDKK